MCLAIPSKVVSIDGDLGVIDVQGVNRNVSLSLLEKVTVGDYVLIHAGFAINVVDENEAAESLKYFRRISEIAEQEGRP